jgi:hypothetical protein
MVLGRELIRARGVRRPRAAALREDGTGEIEFESGRRGGREGTGAGADLLERGGLEGGDGALEAP